MFTICRIRTAVLNGSIGLKTAAATAAWLLFPAHLICTKKLAFLFRRFFFWVGRASLLFFQLSCRSHDCFRCFFSCLVVLLSLFFLGSARISLFFFSTFSFFLAWLFGRLLLLCVRSRVWPVFIVVCSVERHS